jgi:hypothetical protein
MRIPALIKAAALLFGLAFAVTVFAGCASTAPPSHPRLFCTQAMAHTKQGPIPGLLCEPVPDETPSVMMPMPSSTTPKSPTF